MSQNTYYLSNVLRKSQAWDAWVAQSVQYLTSAQVMISWFMGSSPAPGLLLSSQISLQILCPLPPLRSSSTHAFSLKNKYFLKKGKSQTCTVHCKPESAEPSQEIGQREEILKSFRTLSSRRSSSGKDFTLTLWC